MTPQGGARPPGALRSTCAAPTRPEVAFHLAVPFVLAPALVVAFWPVWHWYVARMSDGSDEPLGLIALAVASVFIPRRGWRTPLTLPRLCAVIAVTALYLATHAFMPALVRGMLAITALACVLPTDRARSSLPLVALLLLSLPLIATLQFYLGYPVRAVTAWCAAHLLDLTGHAVVAQGTVLQWAGEQILVDAPCSGIRMLWTSSFLSATLAGLHRLPAWRFVRLAQITAAVVFVANLARTILLFFLETGLWPNPPWAHEAAGLAVFLIAAGTCVAAAHWVRPRAQSTPAATEVPSSIDHGVGLFCAGLLLALASAAAIRPLHRPAESTPSLSVTALPSWPASFEGAPLTPAPLLPIEARFARSFPGATAAFTDGRRRLVMRQVTQATRKLHPIEGCLRASGFAVKPAPAWRHPESGLWGVVHAGKDGRTLRVREHITAAGGSRVWTDVSAWYWSALLQPGDAPWLAITVMEPVAAGSSEK